MTVLLAEATLRDGRTLRVHQNMLDVTMARDQTPRYAGGLKHVTIDHVIVRTEDACELLRQANRSDVILRFDLGG